MTSFSRSAMDVLQAAEDALTRRRSYRHGVGAVDYAKREANQRDGLASAKHEDPMNDLAVSSHKLEELQWQLGRAMRELIDVRAELAAERDRRREALTALGRQWKEDVLVDVHRRDTALHSDVAALEEKMAAQWKESRESRLVMRRQMDEALRSTKTRDVDRFELREELQETTRQLEERVDAALAQSSAARADCSHQLEQERSALSQRLDAELLRLVEMRRDDQRALEQARDRLLQESQRTRNDMRQIVQELWDSSAAALVQSATEPVEQLRTELRQVKATVQAMEEKVADCVRTCQAESRLHTTATAERLRALESKEAAASSSIDRAERKADSAYETARRMETALGTAKDATERALQQVASATERAQKVEHALTDRDARLVAVESQLHAVSTAEGLKAEVEACKRQAGRLESRVEAAGAMCARVELTADRFARQVETVTDRIDECERGTQRCCEVAQGVQKDVEACQVECQQVQNRFLASEATQQRHAHLIVQLEQRVAGQESRQGLSQQQHDQYVKDQMCVQREMMERAEVTHAAATRSQQVSSDARAEVHRLERRLDDVDRSLVSAATETTTLRGVVDSERAQAVELQRQQQQAVEKIRQLEARLGEQSAPLVELQQSVTRYAEKADTDARRLATRMSGCEESLHGMNSRVQDYVRDSLRHHSSETQKRLMTVVNEGLSPVTERLAEVEATTAQVQQRVMNMPDQLAALRQASFSLENQSRAMESTVQTLGGQVGKLELQVETHTRSHQLLESMQQELMRVVAVQQRTMEDVRRLQESLRELRSMTSARTAREEVLNELDIATVHSAHPDMAVMLQPRTFASSPHSTSDLAHRNSRQSAVGFTTTTTTATRQQQQPSSSTTVGRPTVLSTAPEQAPQASQHLPSRSLSESYADKEGSGEQPAPPSSGVSSVRPSGDEVRRLSSVEQVRDESLPPDGDEKGVAGGSKGADRTARGPLAVTESGTEWRPGAAPTETVEQRSVSTSVSAQLSGFVNASHRTAIREFTTAASSTSSSTASSPSASLPDRHAGKNRRTTTNRSQVGRAKADPAGDISSDLTSAITLSSDAGPHHSAQRPLRSQALRSTEEGKRAAATAAASAAAKPAPSPYPTSSQQPQFEDVTPEKERSAPLKTGGQTRVMTSYSSLSVVEMRGEAREKASVDAGRGQQTRTSHAVTAAVNATVTATGSVRSPQRLDWDNWDDDDDAEEKEEKEDDASMSEPQPTQPSGQGQSEDGGEEDRVMLMNAEELTDPTEASETSDRNSSSHGASRTATTLLRRRVVETEELRATPRRTFVDAKSAGAATTSAADAHQTGSSLSSVPRHGRGTTPSSSSSAERAEALGLLGPSQGIRRPQGVAAPTQRYTNFDDSSSSDDEH